MLYELFYIVVYVIIKIIKMTQSYSLENMNTFKNNARTPMCSLLSLIIAVKKY